MRAARHRLRHGRRCGVRPQGHGVRRRRASGARTRRARETRTGSASVRCSSCATATSPRLRRRARSR
jgi:hypothetical protein